MTGPIAASYILAIFAVPLVLRFHLLPAIFAGLAVHVLTVKLAKRLPAHWGGLTQKLALAAISVIVMTMLFGIGLAIWSLLHGDGGMAALLTAVADTLEKIRHAMPPPIADLIPGNLEELHDEISGVLRQHGRNISSVGYAGVKTVAHILLGMIIGGMTALQHSSEKDNALPLALALRARTHALSIAFDKVVFAQVKISALNTVLTAVYLLVILPLNGVHLPLTTVLVPLTFVTGLLPVVGNLLSNTAIVLISLGMSPEVAVASLVFLILIHKLEYLLNAKIVGGEVHARAWELLCAMLALEALFGLPGLVAAPVVYCWLKDEIKANNLL